MGNAFLGALPSVTHFFYKGIIMEKDRIKEIFYATDDSKDIVFDENDPKYKDYMEKRKNFLEKMSYLIYDDYNAYMKAYDALIKEKTSIYYSRGFIRGAETILCIKNDDK